jgi:hypothetical protein
MCSPFFPEQLNPWKLLTVWPSTVHPFWVYQRGGWPGGASEEGHGSDAAGMQSQ